MSWFSSSLRNLPQLRSDTTKRRRISSHSPTHSKNWSGKISYYRFHIQDPIYFQKSIKVTIEHGHANHRSDDYSSTAYWYQTEPHKKFQPLPPVELRRPRKQPKGKL